MKSPSRARLDKIETTVKDLATEIGLVDPPTLHSNNRDLIRMVNSFGRRTLMVMTPRRKYRTVEATGAKDVVRNLKEDLPVILSLTMGLTLVALAFVASGLR